LQRRATGSTRRRARKHAEERDRKQEEVNLKSCRGSRQEVRGGDSRIMQRMWTSSRRKRVRNHAEEANRYEK
jgi:hypothetical protein